MYTQWVNPWVSHTCGLACVHSFNRNVHLLSDVCFVVSLSFALAVSGMMLRCCRALREQEHCAQCNAPQSQKSINVTSLVELFSISQWSVLFCPDPACSWCRTLQTVSEEALITWMFFCVQVSCAIVTGEEAAQHGTRGAWAACLDPKYSLSHRIQSKHCRVYSFGCVHSLPQHNTNVLTLINTSKMSQASILTRT